ncbi:MAG: transposase [Bacteroidales bacterium]
MKERKSSRLQGYDYSSDNIYFVTSCVQNRVCCFGEIVGTGRDLSLQNMDLSLQSSTQNGEQFVTSFIPQMILNEYGTIAEKQWHWLSEQYRYIVLHAFVVMPNHIHGIIEINRSRIISSDPIKIKPLSELIGAYKTTVSKQIHLMGFMEFQWQRSFYEHIIRDEKTFETISDYIINNPVNWEQDKLYN